MPRVCTSRPARMLLRIAIGVPVALLLVAVTWAYVANAVQHPLVFACFLVMPGISLFHVYTSCFFYALHSRRPRVVWQGNQSVDVFVATCGEPLSMIEEALVAARDMKGPHKTWLLDDARSESVANLARRLGVGYLTRGCNCDLKAGGVNAALESTEGSLVCIFDVDHKPDPRFLERTAGYFVDPRIGFVQNAITFRNEQSCWTSRATAETAKDYYALTNCGKDTIGAATLMGSNAVIRRAALESIGGYRPGLAEDLETSVALHAAGWRSAYVAEPLAPGLTPTDYSSFATQQCKWARGVLETGWNTIRKGMPGLTWAQRLGYLLRFSYYLAPPLSVLGILGTATAVLFGQSWIEPVLRSLMPIFLVFMAIRALAFSCFVTRSLPCVTFRGTMLVIATWPAYCRAFGYFALRREAKFAATPKDWETTRIAEVWPQIVLCSYLLIASFAALLAPEPPLVTLSVLGLHLCCHLALLPSLVPGLRTRVRETLFAWPN